MFGKIKPGDYVIYQKCKYSNHLPKIKEGEVHPLEHGEGYQYYVNKYWIVKSEDNENYYCVTPRGKVVSVKKTDPCIRKASLLEKMARKFSVLGSNKKMFPDPLLLYDELRFVEPKKRD